MSWRDRLVWNLNNLEKASFRGAPFYVDSVDTGIGRRNVVHQFPFKDEPFIEDLGPDADEFQVNAYVIQNKDNGFDYFNERDALISALRGSGPGTLVHPSYGEVTVSVIGKARIRESFTAEGGIARFTITFVQSLETSLNIRTNIYTNNKERVDEVAIRGLKKSKDAFAGSEILDSIEKAVSKASGYVHAGVSEIVMNNDIVKFLNGFSSVIGSTRNTITSTVSKVINDINTVADTVTDFLSSPCTLASTVVENVERMLTLIGIPDEVTSAVKGRCSSLKYGNTYTYPTDEIPQTMGISMVKNLVELNKFGESLGSSSVSIYGGGLEPITISSPSTARSSFNRMKLINLVRESAIMVASRVAVRVAYESYNDAVTTMDLIADAIEDLLDRLGDQAADTSYDDYDLFIDNDIEYSALEELRSVFVSAMFDIGADLAKIETYTVPPSITSTLVLAYQKYGDIERDQGIHDRNPDIIDNPCFIPEGLSIELLSE